MKKIYTAISPTDATVIEALLKSHEIPCEIRGFNAMGIHSGAQTEVYVPSEFVDVASYLIKHGELPDTPEVDGDRPSSSAALQAGSDSVAWKILSGFLGISVAVLSVFAYKAHAELEVSRDAPFYKVHYEAGEGCSYGRWHENQQLAFVACYDSATSLPMRIRDYTTKGKLVSETFDADLDGIFEFARGFDANGALLYEWIDDDDDGRVDRFIWFAGGRTEERVVSRLPQLLNPADYVWRAGPSHNSM